MNLKSRIHPFTHSPILLAAAIALAFLAWSDIGFCGEIHDAVREGDLEKVKMLLKANPDLVNAKDEDGLMPLHCAAEEGSKEMMELLLAYKADVNAEDDEGGTPLHWAADGGHKEIVELLLAHGADVNAQDDDG